jgi:hypothetical protein
MGRRRGFFSPPRRRGSSRGEAAALVALIGAGLFIGAIALFGVYLLVVGAIAVVVWIIQVSSKRSGARKDTPALVEIAATQAAQVAPPEAEYTSILPVEPTVFDDPKHIEGKAIEVFRAWAARLPRAPNDASDLVRSLELRTRLVGRLTTDLEGRRVAWRSAPYDGRGRVGAPPLDPSGVDAWNPIPDLRQGSQHIASCDRCKGDGRVPCTSCGGSSRQTCSACDGTGKYYGTTANGVRRLLNCKECRGRGTVVCITCSRGRIECPDCHGARKMEKWLVVDESRRQDVQVEPDGALTRAFAWGQDGVNASDDDVAKDAKILATATQQRVLAADDLPERVPVSWREAYWERIQARIDGSERVLSQTFSLLQVPSIEVTYGVGEHTQAIELEGLRMLAPPMWADHVLTRRAKILGRIALALAALPIGAGVVYLARGTYFLTSSSLALIGGILGAAVTIAALAYTAFWYASLGRRVARVWALSAIAPIAVAVVLGTLVEPSSARVHAHLKAGNLSAAEVELAALGSRDDPKLAALWADLDLKAALAATTCATASKSATKIPRERAEYRRAIGHTDRLAFSEAKSALQEGDPEEAARLLSCGSSALTTDDAARTLQADIRLAQAAGCVEKRDWPCAMGRADEAAALGRRDEAAGLR